MKSLQELYQFYQTELLPQLTILEEKRKESVQRFFLFAAGIIVFTILLTLLTLSAEDLPIYVVGLGIFGVVATYVKCTKDYVTTFKSNIIEEIVCFIEPGLRYRQADYLPLDMFKKSQLFLSDIDVYKGEDMVLGKLDATELAFSEVHAQDERRGHKGRRYYVTIFKGLFFIADFNKEFKGRTFVLPDSAEKVFGGLGKVLQNWNVSRPDLVKLEDPEFEKMFVVYGTDQVEARYILSPSLMKRIVDFKKKSGRKIHLSFIESNVHIAISLTKNLFEPKIFQTIINFHPIQEYYEDLSLAIGIVEDLNLNTRIWSKA